MSSPEELQPDAPPLPESDLDAVRKLNEAYHTIRGELAKVIVGQEQVLEYLLIAIFARGHGLLLGVPGLAKTLMVSTLAESLDLSFSRIQFTPDLMPSDITGTEVIQEDRSTGERSFRFLHGPVFSNVILADEINRTPPKTQAALLEAMQERQVTASGQKRPLPDPFFVLATQNPIEQEGTYPLPEAQVDRFMMKMSVGYPNRADEKEILIRRELRRKDEVDVEVVSSPEKIIQMQQIIEKVHVDPAIMTYMVEIVTRTREDPRVLVGSSPRGSLALFKLSRARAVIFGRDYIIPDDIKAIAHAGLHHRIILKPEPRIRGVLPQDILNKILAEVPVPAV